MVRARYIDFMPYLIGLTILLVIVPIPKPNSFGFDITGAPEFSPECRAILESTCGSIDFEWCISLRGYEGYPCQTDCRDAIADALAEAGFIAIVPYGSYPSPERDHFPGCVGYRDHDLPATREGAECLAEWLGGDYRPPPLENDWWCAIDGLPHTIYLGDIPAWLTIQKPMPGIPLLLLDE
jgi:hypothetical protein